jgi:starch phosphorylase
LCDNFSNIPLYLLDAFLPDNPEMLITGQLYGWFEEERLAQEIILGVGGVRALKALGVKPDVYHFNEGHAVLAGLEMINDEMVKSVKSGDMRRTLFNRSWESVRKKIVFTTHTPVLAGNESHGYAAIKYVGADLGFSKSELKLIGGDPFNMTVAGLRLSRRANAVADLHADTANKMWSGIDNAAYIIGVTNGVHEKTWGDGAIAEAAGKYRTQKGAARTGAGERIWSRHAELKNRLIEDIFARTGARLDAGCLFVGFARRAAPYKRSDLIFLYPEKIEKMFHEKKIKLIFSGKAHPNDMTGKQIVANLVKMAKHYPDDVIFLENYDMDIGALLTRGCDIWLNNPVRPQEASGTSGMKAAMNGVLNFSVLDGWWPEGCVHGENGWHIGGGYEGEDSDQNDAESLYETLSGEIIPTFYNNREKWIDMMAKSIEMSHNGFSDARMLDDYIKKLHK